MERRSLAATVDGILSVKRQTYRRLSSLRFFNRHYGFFGWSLCTFDNNSIWRVQVRILTSSNDTDAMNFRRSVQDECSIIAVASTIVAQIAITALSLDNLSRTPWVARGCFTFSLVSSIIAVYYATKQYCHLGRCLNAEDVRTWIRDQGLETMPPHSFKLLFNSEASEAWRKQHKNFPSVASVLVVSAPNMLLDSSLNAFLIGLGIYLGFIWTRNLDEVAGAHSSQAVFITYIVGLMVCYWVFALSSVVIADKRYISEEELVRENQNQDRNRNQTSLNVRESASREAEERARRRAVGRAVGGGDRILESAERAKRDEESTIENTSRAGKDEQHLTAQGVFSHKMQSNMVAEPGVSTNTLEESAETHVQQDSTTQSISIQEELAQVFQEAARLRTESAKVDEQLSQLLEKFGRGTEG